MEIEKQSPRKVRLKETTLPDIKTREWIVQTIEKGGSIWLIRETNDYRLHVKGDDIDWQFTDRRDEE
jgi:hypothetical protein